MSYAIMGHTSLEDAPGDTSQYLRDKQDLDIGCREENGDESCNEDKARHDGISISEPLGNDPVDWPPHPQRGQHILEGSEGRTDQTYDLAALCTI